MYAIDQLGQIARQRQLSCTSDHALMPACSDHRVKALIIGVNDAHICGLRHAQQITHATIMARRIDVDFFDGGCVMAYPRRDSVKAEDMSGFH